MARHILQWLFNNDNIVYVNPLTNITPIPIIVHPDDSGMIWRTNRNYEMTGRRVIWVNLGNRVQIPPGCIALLVGNPAIERRLNLIIHTTVVRENFRGYINVLVTHAGDNCVTIDAEEDLIEMYLLLNLHPRVEEITDEY